jgi:hypothetical protein
MQTTIRFIGLFVMLYQAGLGYEVLMPSFQMKPKHDSVIAYRAEDRDNGKSTWTPVTKFKRGDEEWEYVEVQKQEITFTGSTGNAPNEVKLLPHLSCCCTALSPKGKGIQAAYRKPDLPAAQKKGAQVLIYQGTAQVVKDPPNDPNARLDTLFVLPTTTSTGITITGTHGVGQGPGNQKTIVLKPGAQVIFGNTPICIIEQNCGPQPMGPGDWKMYYTMAVQSNQCTAVPSQCTACRTSTAACDTSGCVQKNPIQMMTVDCSNSAWP